MEFKKMFKHEIRIKPSDNNGILVEVGCCKLCYSDPDSGLADLKELLSGSDQLEKKYNDYCGPTAEEGPDSCEEIQPPLPLGSTDRRG